jgi:hypothetical protein
VVDKNNRKKMTDHVAEQIEMKFKAATVPQPPTELVWPISATSAALAVRNCSESSRCGRSLCTFVTHLRGCTWQPIFRIFEVLKAVIYYQHKTQSNASIAEVIYLIYLGMALRGCLLWWR